MTDGTTTRVGMVPLAAAMPLLAAHLRIAASQETAILRVLSVARPHLHEKYLAEVRRRADLIEATYRQTPASFPAGTSPLILAADSVFDDICAGRLP